VAKSLDIVGDRWTLLIIRDLLMVGPRKYIDLARSSPGSRPTSSRTG
jgi:DNA-binding HxlR family transcriptional regulator